MFNCMIFFFFFKQKTAYELRISDWSSDVCSSDLFRKSIRFIEPLVFAESNFKFELVMNVSWVEESTIKLLPIMTNFQSIVFAPHFKRSEERREGKECVSTCRSRWSPYNYNNNPKNKYSKSYL